MRTFVHDNKLYEEIDIGTGTWRDFFNYNIEGNFWELLYFSAKWIIFFYAFFYIGAMALLDVLQKEEVMEFICK